MTLLIRSNECSGYDARLYAHARHVVNYFDMMQGSVERRDRLGRGPDEKNMLYYSFNSQRTLNPIGALE